ncbi:DNA-directed DNA polymerase III PolC [Undibacterium sp. GrIS 1.8]|uniref:error-prone DNA polymerase n=1 Tax=Undibacterium sp. GrIS 1.8 TaxID=3143934 RepID=UPI00339222C7
MTNPPLLPPTSPPVSTQLSLPYALPEYAELFCQSNFSFLQGASHAEELATRAAQLNYSALAVTDECSLAGVVRAHVAAKKTTLPLIVGSYFKLSGTVELPDFLMKSAANNPTTIQAEFQTDTQTHKQESMPPPSLIALAKNRQGYGNLSELITLARTRTTKGSYLITPEDFSHPPIDYAHLKGLPDCLLILVPDYPADSAILTKQLLWMKTHFPQRAWISLTLLYQAMDEQHRKTIVALANQYGVPVVATGNICMHVRSRKPLQDVLTAIRLKRSVAECGYDLAPNAEQHLRSRLRLANIYPATALAETIQIASLCQFSLDELRYEYPDELVPKGYTPAAYLKQEVAYGAAQRFPNGISKKVADRIDYELHLINDLAYEPYFLTVYDIVKYARSIGILCQGRGSAANSVVCYCLHITEVDPESSTMLFERFLSKERNEPPDIDVDFEHQRREEVIQYIYNKYGRNRAALAAAVHTFRSRGALRDVGKALGVDLELVDTVAKSHRWFDSKQDLLLRFAESGLDPEGALAQQWASLASQLRGFPRHLSQHTGGFVIARDKLSRLVPIENASMKDRCVIEWDKDDLESLGLLKVDVLALGMLSALKRALALMATLPGRPSRLQDIPREDPLTYQMICKADTIGVFQIESRAQMSMLPRLRPKEFYDLVVQVAIVRPGPIQGGMVHPYLQRRQNKEAVTYPNEEIREALGRTLGIPIFQEQVMQIAVIAAEFSPGEADELRRAMAAWKRKGGLDHYHDRIVNTMIRRGYKAEFAEGIFQEMLGFGEYGFPESHSTSFALLAYASSWIKCHEPAVFLCALLNSQPMGFYSPSQLIQDAKRHQVVVLNIDIRFSEWNSSLEKNDGKHPAVRLGMSLLSGLSEQTAERITQARKQLAFSDINDLARRAQLSRHDLQVLAAGNTLVALAGHRRQALWQAIGAVADKDLLRVVSVQEQIPILTTPTEGQEIASDYHAMGLTLQRHPVALIRPQLLAKRFLPAEMLNTFQQGQFARGCGIVTVRQRPGTANGVLFITIEDETGPVNVIIWPSLVEQQRQEVLNAPLLGVYGIWQCEGDVRHLIAKRLVDMSYLLGTLQTGSRDFC